MTKPIDPGDLFATLAKWIRPKARDSIIKDMKPPLYRTKEVALDVEIPEDLPGIDIVSALRRVDGDKKFFVKLLTGFYHDCGDAAERIREAIDNGDIAAAGRLAHTIKGVAGNLSAKDLSIAAGNREEIILVDYQGETKPLLDRFADELDIVLSSIRGISQMATAPEDTRRI